MVHMRALAEKLSSKRCSAVTFLMMSMVVVTVRLRMDTVDNAITSRFIGLRCSPVQVAGGVGRRGQGRIVAEIAVSGESVSAVARRHGLCRSSCLAGAGNC
jgi:hypothetical protein